MIPSKTKILVVEDMPAVLEMMVEMLQSLGIENIGTAKNGVEAWTEIRNAEIPYDLVISDFNMPISTGMDLLRSIRTSGVHKTLPFLMISANSEEQKVLSAMKAGANYYMVKPFRAPELEAKLRIIFASKGMIAS